MLNPFPELLFLSGFAPFILRVTVGAIFINLGILKLKREKARWEGFFKAVRLGPPNFLVRLLAGLEIVGGAMLVVGLYTQIAALLFVLLTFTESYIEYREETLLKRSLPFYILLFAISLSLVLSGAGLFAFDLPL